MITPPDAARPPRLGPLAAPSERELAAAYPGLRDQALTLPWAGVALGLEISRVQSLAETGELLVIPGPWPVRKSHRSGLGYLMPTWQLGANGQPHPAIAALIEAAAGRGWTSLDLHTFMTTPLGSGMTPASLLQHDAGSRVIALLNGQAESERQQPTPRRRRLQRPRLQALYHPGAPS